MWMLFFLLARIGFIVLLFSKGNHPDLSEWPYTFVYGLRLDLSTCAYLLLLPTLIWMSFLLSGKVWLRRFLHILNNLLLFIVTLIIIANYAVYTAWGTLINARALDFLEDTEGIVASLTTLQLLTRTGFTLLWFFIFNRIYLKWVVRKEPDKAPIKSVIPTLLAALILPILLRGGIQEIPINESSSYFSEVSSINDAANNPVWNLMNNIAKRGKSNKNPYTFYSEEEAETFFSSFFTPGDDSLTIIESTRPNIVLIVLESWTADIIEPLGGEKNTTPFFSSLCDSGILFTNIYSSGRRTDQMFPSVLSGFPSLPNYSISRFSDKIRKLPMLSEDLRNAGYHTSFYYGGELGFANMKSYLLEGKFQEIHGKEDFESNQMNSKWGAHDQYVFEKMIGDFKKRKEPFFSMVLTLSTHEPFEVPGKQLNDGKSEPDKFRNSAFYTDQCLENFINMAKTESWYNNTLFLFVADHGHILPKQRDYYDPACYHIPLLWYGNVITDSLRGSRIPIQGGQHEIATTLLQQLQLQHTHYTFSRDLLGRHSTLASYLNYDRGFGWLEEDNRFVYLFGEKQYIKQYSVQKVESDSSHYLHGKVFLQKLYSTFLKL